MEDNLKIPDGEYNLTIRRQVQNRHLAGTQEYFQYVAKLSEKNLKPSVFENGIEIDKLIRELHGKGIYNPNPKDDSPREIVDTGKIIGQYWDRDEQTLIDTTFIKIVYSKRGVHAYPIRPKW